ncbi:MAG: HAMP domain-containing histidine kinase [Nitrospinota bacterium]|nr:HAMP domain-containing histidine kinase [Nitrospinota bacterium]
MPLSSSGDELQEILNSLKQSSQGFDLSRLKKAARDTIQGVPIPEHPPMTPAYGQICEISRLLINGATSSLVVRSGERWEILGAAGPGSEKIIGQPFDPHGKSVASMVINTRKPYYFSYITKFPELKSKENRNRYLGDGFCSIPIATESGTLLGILNIAGIKDEGPSLEERRNTIVDVLDTIAEKIARIEEEQNLFPSENAISYMQKIENEKEKILLMSIHDLKNTLTLVKANVFFLEQLNLGEEATTALRLIKFGGDRALDTVLSILDSGRMKNHRLIPKLEAIKLKSLVSHVFHEFEVYAGRNGVKLALEAVQDVEIKADRSLLRRILANLIDNALKHSPKGGELIVMTEDKSDVISISVEDQGKGVPVSQRQKIFEMNEMGLSSMETGQKAGYGIGLSFCKLAVHAHGGAIWVESGANGGARFIARFPKP